MRVVQVRRTDRTWVGWHVAESADATRRARAGHGRGGPFFPFFRITTMSKADEADDLYADLYGEEAEPAVAAPAAAPKVESAAPAAAATSAAPVAAAAATQPVAEVPPTTFIPGQPAPPPQDSAEARQAAAARGEHIAPQDLPDEG